MDNFSPADFKHLSDLTYDWLAHLLNVVESGADWPKDLKCAKAAYLSKDPDKIDDPLEYRVLLILPTLYRRWASARLNDLKPWIRLWQLHSMYAGVEGFGAEDAW